MIKKKILSHYSIIVEACFSVPHHSIPYYTTSHCNGRGSTTIYICIARDRLQRAPMYVPTAEPHNNHTRSAELVLLHQGWHLVGTHQCGCTGCKRTKYFHKSCCLEPPNTPLPPAPPNDPVVKRSMLGQDGSLPASNLIGWCPSLFVRCFCYHLSVSCSWDTEALRTSDLLTWSLSRVFNTGRPRSFLSQRMDGEVQSSPAKASPHPACFSRLSVPWHLLFAKQLRVPIPERLLREP